MRTGSTSTASSQHRRVTNGVSIPIECRRWLRRPYQRTDVKFTDIKAYCFLRLTLLCGYYSVLSGKTITRWQACVNWVFYDNNVGSLFINNMSNSTTNTVQVETNMQGSLSHYLQFWPWQWMSMSRGTIFTPIRCQNSKSIKAMLHNLELSLTVSDILSCEKRNHEK